MSTTAKEIILAVVVLAVIAAVAVWYFAYRKPATMETPQTGGIGSDIYSEVAPNAAEKLPETNPFKQETNPFKAVQTNPFE